MIQLDRNIEIGWVGSQDVDTHSPFCTYIFRDWGVRFTYIRCGWFHFEIRQ